MTDHSIDRIPDGTFLDVPGWRGGAVAAGLKPSGGLDLALLVADAARPVAGVFTRNRLPAAPVLFCRDRLRERPEARALLINAGIANAMTGAEGLATTRLMAERVEAYVGGPALVLSTGVIGVQLPREVTLAGIDAVADALGTERASGELVAQAIMTTDTKPKSVALRVELPPMGDAPATTATVGGVAKGSGMIHPNMATMLAAFATDAPVAKATLEAVLRRAVDRSFHEITVDGDTSTNDTVFLFGGEPEAGPVITDDDPRLSPLEAAITQAMQTLATAIIHDGEGVSRVMELRVSGARSRDEARLVAEAVGRSALVKTALAGGDPNFGRILAAAANAGVALEPESLSLSLGGIAVFGEGLPLPVDAEQLDEAFGQPDVLAELDLGLGTAAVRRFVADLTKEYVHINAEYTT